MIAGADPMSSAQNRSSFVGACLSGGTSPDDIDDWVSEWHDTGGAPRGFPESLHDYLGMTWEEYALWVRHPAVLRHVLTLARHGIRFSHALFPDGEATSGQPPRVLGHRSITPHAGG